VDRIADYEIIERLGGPRSRFFLARPPSRLEVDAEVVALKVLAATSDQEAFRRAIRELRAFATVRSPHLVRLYDAGKDASNFFYATEYHPLGSLDAPVQALAPAQTIRAVIEAARAADDLHHAGLVHRNIKPGNVLVTDGGGRLADLGFAQALSPDFTMTSIDIVTDIEFVDPALLRGERASAASDIWSLGATLRHALTTQDAVAYSAVSGVIERCLAADVDQRFGSAVDIARALEAAIIG
jgi:eukaryotic-like serine/threonine-protein kinase